jgi:hypothetical protein
MARTLGLAVQCVQNDRGTFINVYNLNGSGGTMPAFCLGPYEEQISFTQALSLVATELRMDNRGIDLAYK